MSSKEEVAAIYRKLSRTYTTFDQTDDLWMTNGLSSTLVRSIVAALSQVRCLR
ncbi:hypothetical protein [Xanthomonas campestris]|uniref:hypothetical protein n=1 Tax=Xanthomonas campestris TaxID=339 RepID=UPI003CFB9C04